MSDERDETPAQPLPKAEGEDTGVIPVPESTFGHARLHGWRLVGSLAALAGAGAVACSRTAPRLRAWGCRKSA